MSKATDISEILNQLSVISMLLTAFDCLLLRVVASNGFSLAQIVPFSDEFHEFLL